jgi:subtilase family serine protease
VSVLSSCRALVAAALLATTVGTLVPGGADAATARRVLPGSTLDLTGLGARATGEPVTGTQRISVLLRRGALTADRAPEVATVRAWLQDEGLTVDAVRSSVGIIEASGPAASVQDAFATRLRSVEVDGDELVVPDRPASVPPALAGVVRGVAGLVSTPASPMSVESPAAATAETSDACAPYWGEKVSARWPASIRATTRSNRICGYTPTDLRALYRIPADITGAGSRIGIVGTYDDPTVGPHTDDYWTSRGLAPFAPGQYVAHGTTEDDTACGDRDGWSDEQHLDVQAVHALAPDAKVVYWASPTCYSQDIFSTLLTAVESGEVDVVSLSLGSREEHSSADDRRLLHRAMVEASVRGISVFAAAGNDGDYTDDGDHEEIGVTSPASSPFVTAVGGLTMGMRRDGSYAAIGGWASTPYFARNGGLIPPGFAGGGGGGTSEVYRRPGWQQGQPGTGRLLPDVSALADPLTGFAVRVRRPGGAAYQTFGGTSLATPTVATMVSMAKVRSGRTIGVATPWLYRLTGTAALRDVTPPSAAIFSATALDAGQTWPETVVPVDRQPQSLVSGPGWDRLTGVGMPQGSAFFDGFGR